TPASTLPRQHTVLALQPSGQRLGAESHAGGDSGIEPTTSNRVGNERDRTSDQSSPTGVDRILRTIRAIGSVPRAQIHQTDTSGLDDAEVQALERIFMDHRQ